ncbi:hypothetical protein ACFOGJ_15960 [Marinibaculum pumilum]|uniref:Uncharacterized protein n=1 Tax=Marinibaculum pumilum TaxID=1766165 RepID=A0ABV7L290_9PROT
MTMPYHGPESAAKLSAALADAPGPAKALDMMIADALCPRREAPAGESGGADMDEAAAGSAGPQWQVDGAWLSTDDLPYWSGDLAAAAGLLQKLHPGWAWRLRIGPFRAGEAARPFATFHEPETGAAVIGPGCKTEILALLAAGLTVDLLPLLRRQTAGLFALDNPDQGQVLFAPDLRMLVAGYLRLDAAGGATASLRRRHGDGGTSDRMPAGRYRILADGLLCIDWDDGMSESFRRDGGATGQCQTLVRTGTTAPGPHFEQAVRFRRIQEG